jgi:hypothetical protein
MLSKKMRMAIAMMFIASNVAFADEVTEVYIEGQHVVIDIPYFEIIDTHENEAGKVRLISEVEFAPLSFEVDWSTFQEVPLKSDRICTQMLVNPEGHERHKVFSDIADAKLYIEHNATDEDTGVHGTFDDHGWSELCVYDPSGKQVMVIKPQGQLKDLTMAQFFFESREPPNDEYSIADLLMDFPEGDYEVRGISFDGTILVGTAYFTHNIPEEPTITSPVLVEDEEDVEDAVVSINNMVVRWEPVTRTISGEPITITGYEVIITNENPDTEDPHGFSRPIFDVHVPPTRNSLSVPVEFLESDTVYELEVLALEESGNQTISLGFFKTE